MSVLNTAARLAAGKSASPFLQEAERLLSPKGFFSKLEEAVTGLNFNKMPSQQLRKTMEGRQVSPLEYDNVLGHMEGTVSKEEVMNTISKNKTQFDDVVLGETDQSYQDILNKEVSRANEFLQKQDTDIRKEASRLAAGEPTDIITFAQMVSENKSYMPKGSYKISEEYLNKDDAKLPTHYEQYSEPGYVPGSYRERFVTAPPKDIKYAFRTKQIEPGKYQLIGPDGIPTDQYFFSQVEAGKKGRELFGEHTYDKYWKDGHSAYSNIQNPVVRIRYNDRIVDLPKESYSFTDWKNKVQKAYPDETHTDEGWNKLYKISNGTMSDKYIKGKRILFVEEMQGPSSSEQAKMPEFLRKRIYDTGVKKALMLAKEGGYDGVAWTPGDMQVKRYEDAIVKNVNKISWNRLTPTGIKDLFVDIKGHGTTHIQYDPRNNIITAPDGGSTVFGTNVKLEDVVGNNIAEQIVSNNVGNLSGLDLKVGGEGLKYLYDKQIPSLMKKYGKENVSTINIEHQNPDLYSKDRLEGRPILTSVPYIPITQKTPSRHPVYSMIPPTLAGMTAMYRTGEGNAQ